MKLILVVGARPNFIKIAPLLRAINSHNLNIESSFARKKLELNAKIVHTGQHYDYKMSQIFFEDLEIPRPDIYLNVGSGTHAEQTGRVSIEFEKILFEGRPDLVIVVGDVNSTLACALSAVKLHIPVAHVEAGLRSFDRTMPEEINRVLTDVISDFLFTPSIDADQNLRKEGIPKKKIYRVGDVMVDSLLYNIEKAERSNILQKLRLDNGSISNYALLTLHRPSNVDNFDSLLNILKALNKISLKIPIIFPMHPRTKRQIKHFNLKHYFTKINTRNNTLAPLEKKIYSIEPLGYLDFINVMMHSKFIMTDSGSIQEESTVLKIPCLTLRDSTERPLTVSKGTNTLVHNDSKKIIFEAFQILEGKRKKKKLSKLHDGKASERIVQVIIQNHIK